MRIHTIAILLLSFSVSFSGYGQDNSTDSIKTLLRSSSSATDQLRLLNELCLKYMDLDVDSALHYANRSIVVAQNYDHSTPLAEALRNKADAIARSGDDSLAVTIYQQALALNIPSNDKVIKANIHRQMGNAHYHLAQYDEALRSFFTAISLFDHDSLKKDRAGVLNNIGNVYYFTDQVEAIKYYSQSLELHQEMGYTEGIASQLGNIGLIYIATGKYEKAIDHCERSLQLYRQLCYEQSVDLSEQMGHERSIARSQVNLSYAYKEVGKTDLALKHAQESLQLRKKLKDVRGVTTSTIMIGNIYYSLKEYGTAIPYLEEGLKMTRELGMRSYEWEVMAYLAECYADQDQTEKALDLYPKLIAIKDSKYKQEAQAQMAEMETKYQTLQKDGQIELLTKETEINNLQIRKRETMLGATALVTFLLGIISLFIYFAYRSKSKVNVILKNKNEVIGEKNHHITESIRYAQRLQTATLPKTDTFDQAFRSYHILYRPKDIVSGDFYWLEVVDEMTYLAVADCTGHGVPGAMVSMIGVQGLNKAVIEEGLRSPAEILQRLSDHIEEAFEKSGGTVKDGMDICLCVLNSDKTTLTYAGANNSLLVVSARSSIDNSLLRGDLNGLNIFELKAARRSIVGFFDAGPFTEKTINLQPQDRLFLYSDGFADQFGGPKNRKLGSKRMRQIFLETSATDSVANIDTVLQEWQEDEIQIDDVTVISIEV